MADASATVLRDVSLSLGALIKARVYVEAPGDVEVEYHSPSAEDAHRQGRQPLILVYLYRLTDNPFLRNTPPSLVRGPGGFIRQAAPAPVDLLYMMVPYAQSAETELILIDELKRLFADVAALEGDLLKGSLRRTDNEHLSIISDNLTLREIHDIWAGFPQKPYRLALYYIVTPVRIPRATREPADRVLEISSSYESEEADR